MKKKNSSHKVKHNSLFEKLKHQLYFWLKLYDYPIVKVYHGYGNANQILVIGHVLKLSPTPRKTYRQNWITNFFAIIRLFCVIPFAHAKISIEWNSKMYEAKTEKDGFFKLEINMGASQKPGWHSVSAYLNEQQYEAEKIFGVGKIYIPSASQHAFISDIDDTFLISHSQRMRRRLFVLFSKNARSRKFFAGVIHHYRQLAVSGQKGDNTNPFFYVSSSEWNLYDYIVEFCSFNELPKGVFLLGQMKRLKDFWKSGQNNHATKFMRIVRIIQAYPNLKFVLLGDDSQQDPEIYEAVAAHYPNKILAVYIRRVYAPHYKNAQAIIDNISSTGVACCYFQHSSEAIIHSKSIGLILSEEIRNKA